MTFGYHEYFVEPNPGNPNGILYRPVIPVQVSGPSGHTVIMGLLDTGADATILPSFILNLIGAKYDGGQTTEFVGIGGQAATVHYASVELSLDHPDGMYRWKAKVGFLEGSNVAILGHAAFLNYFHATFNGELLRVNLRANKMFPGEFIE